jgi:hypothetical protein
VICFQSNGNLHGHRIVAQLFFELPDHAKRIGTAAVALVDKGDAGYLVALHLLIDGDGLALDPANRAENQDGAVQHTQASLHLNGKVHMARRIDDIDLVFFPLAVSGGRGNGDPAFLLKLHGVHGRAYPVLPLDVVDGVDPVRIKQDPLGKGGFP